MSETTVAPATAPAPVELEVGYAGKSIPRKEDGRLVQGQGVFADEGHSAAAWIALTMLW